MQIVSLTTDYGTRDYYVAELKAMLLGSSQDLQVVDVSNEVDKFDIVQASFFLKNVMYAFPVSTIHVVAVHCHSAGSTEIICFQRNKHWFIGPNNGVFSLVFDDLQEEEIFVVSPPAVNPFSLNRLISHAAAYLSHQLPLHEIGPSLAQFVRKLNIQPVITSGQIRATIVHIDYFENVIVNLRKETFDRVCNGREFEIYYKPNEPITCFSRNYGEVGAGEALAFFNSSGYLEIALNMDRAASMLHLHKNETIQINFK
ncbi:MAG: SAM-dependent chlorinase/fluorinase [Saprospiraceae bacterium]|jgi:S-adenosylmethionine hydrolase|nr:SAM-dependent chlorinase/fluorinase [Saprospiraceae bacterium]